MVHPNYFGLWGFCLDIFGISSDPITVISDLPERVNFRIVEQPPGLKENVTIEDSWEKCEKTGNFLKLVTKKNFLLFILKRI